MEVPVGLALWVGLAVVVLLPPLVRREAESLARSWPLFDRYGIDDEIESATTEPRPTQGGRPMTDGGRVCHNCGNYIEGDYQYCAACLMPKV